MTYRRKDPYHRRAREAGYRARSAYKLVDLDRRFTLFGRGDVVVDLGAWPGAWIQVALERVGPRGRIVAVDVAEIEPFGASNVILLRGDVREQETLDRVRAALPRRADALLVDLAPKLTGVRATDEARCAELVAVSLDTVPRLLRRSGRLCMKLFTSPDLRGTLTALRRSFASVHSTRPGATRRGSAELYVVATGFEPDAVS